ncbi:histidine phosphatase family protein [Fictibacillus phosphorivorans]|uniref:histidine phosphatase family protein n=1 Tax=Fictibacillus phosphorivorans TaxID=1221500 RepID=UPI00203AE01C|nr:histidine phosphatase family protein [Fictibacillus phosphorivorans]MCM3719546.1 histidine phosphatase family protein [Fictibacillus phosphorivorans]MCM3777237.1 histidine phosphatase family protein [Fictibacillus phosphorivorans]
MNRTLLDSLKRGGFIFYVRHGEANVGRDSPYLDFQNCLTQRNLSEKGRRQAKYYGEILRYLQIPIHYPVSASPYCRTIETAQLAFGRDNVQVDPFWLNIQMLSGNLSSIERQRILNHLKFILETKPEEGTNKVIVAHSFPNGMGLGRISNMGTVIIQPYGRGNGYIVVGRLSIEDWSTLDRFIKS